MRLLKMLLVVSMSLLLSWAAVYAQAPPAPDAPLDYLLKQYASKKDLTDWEALVLGVNGVKIKTPFLTTPYFKRLEKEVAEKKGEYRLATDYARIALVYKSHGKDPSKVAGYSFIEKMTGFSQMGNQGLNAYIWVLVALYGQPSSVTEPLTAAILAYQLPTGGFSITPPDHAKAIKPKADIDLTAMAVTALSPYQAADEKINDAVQAAIAYMSEAQEADGSFQSSGVSNAESVSQVIIALCAAGTDMRDARFVKNGKSLLDVLDGYRLQDGTYAHLNGGEYDPIATRQAALALSAYRQAQRFQALTETEQAHARIKQGIFEISR